MKLDRATTKAIGTALASACPPERLRVRSIENFAGPTPGIPSAALVARIECRLALPALAPLEQRLPSLFPFALPLPDGMPAPATGASAAASLIARCAAGILKEKLGLELGCGADADSATQARFWFEPFLDGIAEQVLTCALVGVGALLGEQGDPAALVAPYLGGLDQCLARRAPVDNIQVMIDAARRRGIPALPLGDFGMFWHFGWGARSDRFWISTSDGDGAVGFNLQANKDFAKALFRDLGIPTPAWQVIGPRQDPGPAAAAVGWPCVVKPVKGGQGDGVNAGIADRASLDHAVAEARKFGNLVLIEAHVPGQDHRLMVIDGKLVCAVNRRPPAIVGDGTRSVRELIEAFNAPLRGPRGRYGFHPVPIDNVLAFTLRRQDVGPDSIPAAGREIALRTNANFSTGGMGEDVTARVHPRVRAMAVEMTAAFGQRVAGIDYVTTDITRSPEETGGSFIEINGTAGLNVILATGFDEDELGALLLGDRPGRIPVALILVAAGQRQAAEKAIAKRAEAGTAAASAAWAQIGSLRVSEGLKAPLGAINAALRNANVERLMVVWTLDDLAGFGLPLDAFDTIAVVGDGPAEPWLELLRARSKRLLTARTAVEAARLSFDTA